MDELTRTNLVANHNFLSPTLQCSICLDLVMDPLECKNCSKLFCKDCINDWLKKSTTCPNKHPFIRKSQLDEWIITTLNKIYIKCPYKTCNSNYSHSNWSSHIKRCQFKSKGVIENDTPIGDEIFQWKEIQFFVRDINNHNHTFILPLSTTVKELKERLKDKTGFRVEDQRLSVMGKNMEDSKMLEYYCVQNNSTIYHMGRLKGGL